MSHTICGQKSKAPAVKNCGRFFYFTHSVTMSFVLVEEG